ncbi:MAG TPA: isoleucine--tRNA ligase [Thermoanaerobaculia bacterium]|nr:isoleucine--tRNA ligase [Thermoanaerobaculia bacterium]
MSDAPDYKSTLNLPSTAFPMKAELARREPERLAAWKGMDLEGKVRAASAGREKWVFHDGPPYANGHTHLGTALNKIIKDAIVRSRTMEGFDAAFVPGWDCHGLPIERQVDKELGAKRREMSDLEIRRACRAYAEKFVAIQMEEFERLGVLAEWSRPYLTMAFPYEAEIARCFGEFYARGLVYRALKSVRWCFTDRTALAEAELEYSEKSDPAILVAFRFAEADEVAGRFEGMPVSAEALRQPIRAVIWTTTPWTIPSNAAIAVHPEREYVLATTSGGHFVVARDLLERTAKDAGWTDVEITGVVPGARLVGLRYEHPLPAEARARLDDPEKAFRVVAADYVTMDTGTGLVHTAPGHGEDDFRTGQREGLPVLSPLDDAGRFTEEVPRYRGTKVLDANPRVIEDLREAGALVHADSNYRHEYPHCWRCRNPVIFRATEQWFVDLEKPGENIRERAAEAIRRVRWIPAWGAERIGGMVENRHEWCVSRQRRWGSPITVVSCASCRAVFPDPKDPEACGAFFAKVVAAFREAGGDAWFDPDRPAAAFLPEGFRCSCGGTEFVKERDVLDVWFDSGVSHEAVLKSGVWPDLRWPADVYVEGHDQHRGWFQSSLLTSVALENGQAPFRTVITHGFVVDGQGRKMSKSLGNVITSHEIVAKEGADVLRLWVLGLDYREDQPLSPEIVARTSDVYRKIRNTARYLLSNLFDFDPERDAVADSALLPFDRWAVARAVELERRVRAAFEAFEFHAGVRAIHDFCVVSMSSLYLDVLKDRLYASAAASPERRSAQNALYRIGRRLATLTATILPFTAEEIYEALPGKREQSVHLERFARMDAEPLPEPVERAWERLLSLREEVTKVLEDRRKQRVIGSSLEAALTFSVDPALAEDRRRTGWEGLPFADFFIVSDLDEAAAPLEIASAAYPGLTFAFRRAAGRKCARCWKVRPEVPEGGVCERCRSVLTPDGRASAGAAP